MGKEPKVAREVAEQEVQKWLDSKKVFDSTIEENQDSIKILTEAIMQGTLTLNDDFSFTHKLLFPLGDGETMVGELKYKHRINEKETQKYLKGVSAKDGDGRLNATIAALCNTARGIIEGLDTMDKKISNAIAIFFF